MKKTASISSQASAVLYVLVVMAIGGVVLAAWINLLANRVLYTDQLIAGVGRRVTLENSRAMATQYLLQNVLPGSHSNLVSAAVDDNWGAFTIDAPAGGLQLVPLESVAQPEGNNPFSPGGDVGYTVDLPVTLSDGVNDQTWTFQARSRSPIFSFDLYTAQRPTLNPGNPVNVSTGLHVNESSFIWVPNSPNSYGITTARFETPTVTLPGLSVQDAGGNTVLMSNFPFLPITSGNVGSAWGYDGAISNVRPTGSINSLTNHATDYAYLYVDPLVVSNLGGIMSDGAGNVTIDLLEASLMRVFIDGNVTTLHLTGHASGSWAVADDRPALLVVYLQTAATSTNDLATVELLNESNRRLYLAIKKNTGTGVNIQATSTGTPLRWRLAATVENTPVNFALAGGSLELRGGIRSDASISVSGGSMSIVRELDPKLLERHADRIAWLESYRQ